MKYVAVYGERYVEVRPVPHGWLGTAWRVTIDGDPMSGDYAYLSDAREAAEARIGVSLNWTEEPTPPGPAAT